MSINTSKRYVVVLTSRASVRHSASRLVFARSVPKAQPRRVINIKGHVTFRQGAKKWLPLTRVVLPAIRH